MLMGRLQEGSVSCVSGIAQKAAEAALAGPQDCVAVMRETYREHLQVAREVLDGRGIPYPRPSGRLLSLGERGVRRFGRLHRGVPAREAGLGWRSGATFGPSGRHYVRISLASDAEHIRQGLLRLADFVDGR